MSTVSLQCPLCNPGEFVVCIPYKMRLVAFILPANLYAPLTHPGAIVLSFNTNCALCHEATHEARDGSSTSSPHHRKVSYQRRLANLVELHFWTSAGKVCHNTPRIRIAPWYLHRTNSHQLSLHNCNLIATGYRRTFCCLRHGMISCSKGAVLAPSNT